MSFAHHLIVCLLGPLVHLRSLHVTLSPSSPDPFFFFLSEELPSAPVDRTNQSSPTVHAVAISTNAGTGSVLFTWGDVHACVQLVRFPVNDKASLRGLTAAQVIGMHSARAVGALCSLLSASPGRHSWIFASLPLHRAHSACSFSLPTSGPFYSSVCYPSLVPAPQSSLLLACELLSSLRASSLPLHYYLCSKKCLSPR